LVAVDNALTTVALFAITLTVDPAVKAERETLTASAASTELSDGTVTFAGVALEVAVVITTPLTDTAIV
jgi:hypothetical protein